MYVFLTNKYFLLVIVNFFIYLSNNRKIRRFVDYLEPVQIKICLIKDKI